MQDMTQCTASMKNPEENMNEGNQAINDLSSDNQNLGHGGINEDGAEDDVVTYKNVDNTIAESSGANGALEATVIVGSQNSGSKDDVSSRGKKMTESLAVLSHGNGASQDTPTIIIETQKSDFKDEVISPRKRKRKGRACISSPESSDSVASRTRHKLATKSIGKSPLCQQQLLLIAMVKVEVKKTLYMLKMFGSKGCDKNVETMKQVLRDVTNNHEDNEHMKKYKKYQGTKKSGPGDTTAAKNSAPHMKKITPDLKNKAPHSSISKQVQSKTKSPYFNSPSVPPFRIFDDEDDLRNYTADPRKRRPVGESGPTLPRHSTSKRKRNCSETSHGQNTHVLNDLVNDDHEDVLIMESLPLTDETSEEFAKRRNCKTSPTVNSEVSSSAISPIVPVEQPVPLALEMPGGEYVDLSQESPEVAAVIARKTFFGKCSELSNKSNKTYNWSFGNAQYAARSSSGKMAMYRPRRFHVPSRYVSSPYVHERTKVSTSAKERDVYRVLLDVSNSNHNKKYIIDYKNVVKFGSLGSSLRPGGKVETYVVNALCKKIFDKLHARRSLKHFFLTLVSDFLLNNYDFKNEEERRKRFSKAVSSFKGANAASLLYNSELQFFPIFFENHWCVIVAIIKEWVWAVIEPCLRDFGPDSAFHQRVKAVFLQNFMKLWKQSGKVDCSFSDKFQFVDVPQCSNNEDDGILINKFLEEWEPIVDLKSKFKASDVPNLRIKYANEMIFNQSNVANNGLSILKSFDNEVYSKYFQGEA